MLAKYKTYECTYLREGISQKEGPNQGKSYQNVQLTESDNESGYGRYTHSVFVWVDDYKFDLGSVYNCMISNVNGRSQLLSVE